MTDYRDNPHPLSRSPAPQMRAPRIPEGVIWAGVILCGLGLMALPAFAERVTIIPTPDSAAHYALIEVQNRIGTYNETREYQTQHGPVSISYTTTRPSMRNDPASADTACVVALPDGVVAVPQCVDVLELETGQIALMLYEGM